MWSVLLRCTLTRLEKFSLGFRWDRGARHDEQESWLQQLLLPRLVHLTYTHTYFWNTLRCLLGCMIKCPSCPSPMSNGTISGPNIVGCVPSQNSGFGNSLTNPSRNSSTGPSMSSPHRRFHSPSHLLIPSASHFMGPCFSRDLFDHHGSDTVRPFNL